MKCPTDCERVCFYCDQAIPPRDDHEHDHYPIAKRHGGEHTVPACLKCHDLKDRIPLKKWPVELAAQAFLEAGPLGRLLIAKAAAMCADNGIEASA